MLDSLTIKLDEEQQELVEEWFLTVCCIDLFSTDHCGHWACHLASRPSESLDGLFDFLVYDEGEPCDQLDEESEQALTELFQEGGKIYLPDSYHIFNYEFFTKVLEKGIWEHGVGFLDGTADASDLDNAVQRALFGEVQYC